MTIYTCVEDLRRAAERKVPRMFFDYVSAGSYSESTKLANRADLEKLRFRQRVLVDVSKRDTSTTILGEKAALPLVLAPLGSGGMLWADGEIHALRAASEAGVPYTLSTNSIVSMESLAATVAKPFWFQLYVMRERKHAEGLIERAIAAKCSALVLTVDLPVLGQRHVDVKNGLSVPIRIGLDNLFDMATKLGWGLRMLGTKNRNFGNLAGRISGVTTLDDVAEFNATQIDPALSWDDVAWVKSVWPGKLVIKGILDADDARRAVDVGADAIVVSNHGGRQLDGAPSTISALPAIAGAVGSEIEVLLDGGIRTGQDVMRALALGARACLIGRAYAWGLGADGQRGVANAIAFIKQELSVTMALTGVTRIADIDRSVLLEA